MSKIMLNVQIEIDGTFKTAGVICGSDYRDSFFTFAEARKIADRILE